MDDNTARLAQQLRQDPAMLQSLMGSADGQTLMRMLTAQDQGAGLQQAVHAAMKGDTGKITEMLQSIMQSPDGAALVERLNRAAQK